MPRPPRALADHETVNYTLAAFADGATEILHQLRAEGVDLAQSPGSTSVRPSKRVLAREGAEASAARADDAIREIQAALVRVEAGTYGTCERCDGTIRLPRLEAIPYARLCVDCHGHRGGILR